MENGDKMFLICPNNAVVNLSNLYVLQIFDHGQFSVVTGFTVMDRETNLFKGTKEDCEKVLRRILYLLNINGNLLHDAQLLDLMKIP